MANENSLPLYEALLRLRNMPEMAPFRDYLKSEEAKAVDAMIGMNEDRPMYRAQGAVRQLRLLQILIEDAAKVRDKVVKPGMTSAGFL